MRAEGVHLQQPLDFHDNVGYGKTVVSEYLPMDEPEEDLRLFDALWNHFQEAGARMTRVDDVFVISYPLIDSQN